MLILTYEGNHKGFGGYYMKVRKISLTKQILIINVVVLLVATLVLGIFSTIRSNSTMEILIKQRMLDISNTAAAGIDGDELEILHEQGAG